MGEECNLSAQIDEVEAMAAIYGDDWVVDSEANRKYSIRIAEDIQLQVRLTDEYPSHAPPYFELDAVPMTGTDRTQLSDRLNSLYAENIGQPILYIWAEACKECVTAEDPTAEEKELQGQPLSAALHQLSPKATVEEVCPNIFHDEPVTDRKSTFQAHVAKVDDVKQVSLVMETLLSNKKISAATHNIQAYRLELTNGSIAKDFDDDGETAAGKRLLTLLDTVKAVNVVVVVSRWYGGIQLGPDRFKHINNCARNALEKQNFIPAPVRGNSKTSHRKS